MVKKINQLILLLSLSSLIIFTSCEKGNFTVPIPDPVTRPDLVFYGLTGSNGLVRYNANNPAVTTASVSISGLPASERIIAIDFRPATGQLYGLGISSRLYIINHENGRATMVGTSAFSPALSGSLVAFDFNPTVDRIRVVTSGGQNLRLNPETGGVAATDGNLNPANTMVGAVAYTNSFPGASTTTLFDLDFDGNKLYKQDPPNNGTLVEVGSLDIDISANNDGGFDISPDNSVALANLTIGSTVNLFQIDLTTGKATDLGTLSVPIIGLAIPTNPVAYAVDMNNNLQIFNLNNPGTPVNKAIIGLQTGENIVGIDMRPATGQLYALGSTSRLYVINMSSGAATAIGTGSFTPLLSGTSFGFDFNPTVDRIRLVSNTGQDLRLNPNDGTVAAVDGMLNPGTPMVTSVAYTNNFSGATSTTLYDIDFAADKLFIQNPPNNGTLIEVGSLGIDVTSESGFDIGGTSNRAYALLTVAGTTRIYTISLTSGAATQFASFPNATRGFAVGLGF